MVTVINIPKTSIKLEISKQEIEVVNLINYDIKVKFRKQDDEPTLDEDGDLFEPVFWLDIQAKPEEGTEFHSSLGIKAEKRKLAELQHFFEYIEENKRNLFDLCGFRGELT